MTRWRDRRFLDLVGIELPIIQAPMAGSDSPQLAAEVSRAGGLGSLAGALLSPEKLREGATAIRAITPLPFNLNFFCHTMTPAIDPMQERRWKQFLRPHYERMGLDIENVVPAPLRMPFDEAACAAVEEIKPAVVSFHFGLPAPTLLQTLKTRDIKILASATSVDEARWLAERGCDAIIAQGAEAGGHRSMFLDMSVATQTGLMSLVPQTADAVSVPVIAAGGIMNGGGIVAALALGASAVQLGTAYLFCPEAKISPLYRRALCETPDNGTAITNLFSGRPARGIANRFVREAGPMSDAAPDFPHAATLIAPLRTASEKAGVTDYMQMWAGQSARLGRAMGAYELTKKLAEECEEGKGSGAWV
jgi:nitronate monooxygenase